MMAVSIDIGISEAEMLLDKVSTVTQNEAPNSPHDGISES